MKASFKKTLAYTKKAGIFTKFLGFCMFYLIQKKQNHKKVIKIIKYLIKTKNEFGFFYLAYLEFFYAKFKNSLKNINIFLQKQPKNIDALYFKVQILTALNENKQAFLLLEEILKLTQRVKTWFYFRDIIATKQEFYAMFDLYESMNFTPNKQRIFYILAAAFKVKEYDFLSSFLQTYLLNTQEKSIKKTKNNLNINLAKNAFLDIKEFFDFYKIEFFLVSGTFLGLVRENGFLKHDYDIDCGIFYNDLSDDFKKNLAFLLCSWGCFMIHEKSNDCFKLKHINGVFIDVFIHYEDEKGIYHNAQDLRWYNSKFTLAKYKFYTYEVLAAKDYDLYLKENYGLYKEPKIDYDILLDTPNAHFLDKKAFIAYLYLHLMKFSPCYKRILEKLKQIGQENFVLEFNKTHQD